MKKKLSLLLAATMVLGMMPVSAFATTSNSVSKVVTVKDDGFIDTDFAIEEKDATPWSNQEQFELSLNNAKWEPNTRNMATSKKFYFSKDSGSLAPDGVTVMPNWGIDGYYRVLDDSTILMTIDGSTDGATDAVFSFPVKAEADGKGDCTITVDPMSSRISGGTWTIASALGGATKTTIAKTTDIQEGGTEIKNLVVTEVTPASLKANQKIKVKLSGDYEWINPGAVAVSIVAGDVNQGYRPTVTYDTAGGGDDKSTLIFELNQQTKAEAYKIVIGSLKIKPTDDAEYGETVEVTISGAGMTKETIEVGKYVDYGYTWTAEDKDVPVVYSGRTVVDDDILKATFKETIANSWLNGRKTTIEFPDGVKIMSVDIDTTDVKVEEGSKTNFQVNADSQIDGGKLTLTSDFVKEQREGNKKAELEFTFGLAIAPDFVGDLTATISGSGVSNQESTVTLAKVEPPVIAKTEANEVKIDYRNTAINDITLTEAYPGALKKGTHLVLRAEQMQFESGIEYEVVSGDLKVDKLEITKGKSNNDGGLIDIKIKSESAKEAGVIKLSNIQLYLERSLPAGDYALYYVPYNFNADGNAIGGAGDHNEVEDEAFFRTYDHGDDAPFFDIDEVKAVDKFLTVITAGRDVDDSTFTTKVSVTIGASEMTAGERTIPLDVPAYISADGYTMLPLRAVTEALSDKAIINWDNDTRTVTIIFGSRIISMTVGSNVMTINGTAVAMSAKVEITGERSFVPLRDLGVALGVNESKINWDAATKTATLN